MTILIVDDNEMNIYQLHVLLGGNGFQVVTANNGAEALATARRNPPDLIISDILMPVMDGFALCHEWKKDDLLRQIPFVFYTATYTDERDREFALSLGAEQFLVKPEEPEIFIRTIREVIHQFRRPPASPPPVPVGELPKEESGFLKQYNEVLIHKLEAKMQQLEQANRELERDIAARKRAEEALRDSEESYRLLFEVESDAILVVEVDSGRIVDANLAALKLYGYSREEFLSLTAGEVFAEREKVRAVLADDRAQVQLRWHRKKDGAVFPVELTGNSFVNQGRRIHVAAIRDITERLRAEVERTRLVAAIEQSAEAVVITNTNGEIEYVNPAFTRISGYSREEVLGRNPRILKSGKHDPLLYQQLWGTILEGKIWRGEVVNRRKDGSLYTEEMNIAPVRDALGEITHFIATKQDVTANKAMEERLRQAAKMEAIGRLAGGVAHDFNNLLTIINGYSELGLDGLNSDDPMRRYINEIMKAGDRAASLTRQLLAFSRQQVLAPQILDLNGVVANVGEMLHRLIGENINLEMVLDPTLGHVKADAGQIEQILMNLGVNARDAMPQGGKLLIETTNVGLDDAYASNHSAFAPGRYVMLAVSDTGIGMDAEIQAHIFEPFFTTKEKDKGTGLGLATVYGIVKQSGGYVWVYSEPGRGSTFKIYLPRVAEAGESAQFPEAPGRPVAASETILLVEDEEAVRALAARILQRLGYKVLESTSPEDALEISERHTGPIHLLLTDVVLPSMSGRKVAEFLAPLRPGMKALYMSGYTDDAIVRNGVLEATAAFLQKPFTPATLARKVREVLDAGGEEGLMTSHGKF
ncbi:MAG TPA: PAS domain S-box protein [Terriglobia bacterium]|nr:PAS domain S-box protein [Terriglobia bacterium]